MILPLLFAASCTPTVAKPGSPANAIPPTTYTESPTIPSATLPPQSQPTLPPQPQPTLTPQPQSTISPQQQSNCTDSASFVADVTVPDNTKVDQGKTFVKTWRIRNTGTCTWDTNYSMVFVNGDQMNSVATIPFKVTPPGGTLDVSVNLVAPSANGAYTGNYELQNDSGQTVLIDNTRLIWVKITVASNNTQQPNPTPGAALETQTPVAGTSGDCSFFENSLLENELISLINSVRINYGLQALVYNRKLSGAAIGHSIDMAAIAASAIQVQTAHP